ncbi:helix-turn-helix domain-containing protein [Sabulicella glaciei]|uniref:Helix-turn-helix domain-containing protein n=1 Tax=Sabulicella glaciei TaxID=2984948 RepID=A0ABT3NSH3_9PROT|nr:helix-turn-helix domain-containing protein [Roseococcus sp. MDT2-1-1]MCW8085110.1 helix-turn-helix domain-containing protein [Roseococcus sp. MDT2-1-1]
MPSPHPTARVLEIRSENPEAFGATSSTRFPSRLILRGRGPFAGWRRRLVLDETLVHLGRVNLPVTFHNATGPRATFSLAIGEDRGPRIQGQVFGLNTLVWWRAEAEVHTQWPAGQPWWNLGFPLPRLLEAARQLHGVELPKPRASAMFLPLSPARCGALLKAAEAALNAPGWVGTDRLVDGLLNEVLGALFAGIPAAETPSPSLARRAAIADGLVAIAERETDHRSLIEVCAELGVPLRTLNACANSVLGMSAAAYLRARRLVRVRAVLEGGEAASVTEAATRFGFWELGRFSAAYRAQFGEAPLATLRHGRRSA